MGSAQHDAFRSRLASPADWTTVEIVAIHDLPLLDLIAEANRVHRHFHDVSDVQKASLLSIKTGGCPENCAYCPQSAHYREVHLDKADMMETAAVLALAARAKTAGADRFCMGAAWRNVRDGAAFDAVLDMVRGVRALEAAMLTARLHFGMKNTDLEGRECRRSRLISAGMASQRFLCCKGCERSSE